MIRLEKVTKGYRAGKIDVRALRGVDPHISRGEFVAAMVGSGSGKSTMTNILSGLNTVSQGRYQPDGVDIAGTSGDHLADIRNAKIGLVSQPDNLLASNTTLATVEPPSLQAKPVDRRRRTRQTSGLVDPADRAHHRPHQLPDAQQQRMTIARTLATEPT
jgi:putative ABC transport system ATP-binding protein